MNVGLFLAILGAALAVALSGTGSAKGIGFVATAASGALSEDPKKFGKFILLVALPGTQGIYGFVMGFLTIQKIGLLTGETVVLTLTQGLEVLFMNLPIAIAGLFSAIHQGKVCAGGVNLISKQEGEMGKALVMGVLVEFYAVLGLLVSIFIWLFLSF
ncbi:MAG: permease [Spirochaetes bacterium DG_61]|jgi:V/A-type H+-transporting ATPase subunit K|nr:MAG: permease [Spirochaetes bacterium DG_61]